MIGRLAPSPTGAQHLGNARTFLVAWLLARKSHSKLWLRLEDLETPRVKAWATAQVIEDLAWLGLDWDPYPGCSTTPGYVTQSHRIERYEHMLGVLRDLELVYPCVCTRSQVEAIVGAPHEAQPDGPVYPGTCSTHSVADAALLQQRGLPFAWRFRVPSGPITFSDQFCGYQRIDAMRERLGDFIVARASGVMAYQLAVVVDDHEMGVEQVVRGDDLLVSTFRQLALYAALGWTPPHFCHLPLVVGHDGRRLAKRHGDTRLAYFRDMGVPAEAILGYLAYRSGLCLDEQPKRPHDFLQCEPLSQLLKSPMVIDASDIRRLIERSIS